MLKSARVLKCIRVHRLLDVVPHRTMACVSVRKVQGDERMQISFELSLNLPSAPEHLRNKPKVFNLDRLQSESLEKSITRIRTNVSKELSKKKKKKKPTENGPEKSSTDNCEELQIQLVRPDGVVVDEAIPNADSWEDGSLLKIGDQSLNVVVNPPSVQSLSLPKCIIAAFPMEPLVYLEFADLRKCEFVWYRETKSSEASKGACDWVEVHRGPHYSCYFPVNIDISHRLKVTCTPRDGVRRGETKEAISKTEVIASPGLCPFENRHQLTQTVLGADSLRVMTYNILADVYADSDYSRDRLYAYCPPYALSIDYRKQLLLKEIMGYNADIICLQEVDRRVFLTSLLPTLDNHGFEGFHKCKLGQVPEGSATFIRRSKFRVIGQHDIGLTEALKTRPEHQELYDKLRVCEPLMTKMNDRHTVFQVTVVESVDNPERRIVIATTHLYFQPGSPNVRVIQVAICVRHLELILKQYTLDNKQPGVIFCGDFNSYLEGGLHVLLREGRIPPTHADWYAGGKEELVNEMDISHSLSLTNVSGSLRYTNYVAAFSSCLDYIYSDCRYLRTDRVIPMSSHEEVTQFTALPNPVFPSDHMSWVTGQSDDDKTPQ